MPRKTIPASLSSQAIRAQLRSAGTTASQVARKHSRLTAAVATTATAGAIAAVAIAAPWAGSAAASTAASGHASHATKSAPALSDAAAKSVALPNAFSTPHAAATQATQATAAAPAAAVESPTLPNAFSTAPAAATHATQAAPAAAVKSPTLPNAFSTAPAAATQATPAAATPAAQNPAAQPAAVTPAAAKPAATPAPAGPTTFYDSVSPGAIPSGQAEAVYADGSYQATAAQTAGHQAMWIDTNGSNTSASALDVEPGDATPAGAAAWVQAKLTKNPGATAIVYTFKSDWSAVQANINALPAAMSSHVKYWIADPTGSKHILPGADATQWYWGASYDISAANPGFFQQ